MIFILKDFGQDSFMKILIIDKHYNSDEWSKYASDLYKKLLEQRGHSVDVFEYTLRCGNIVDISKYDMAIAHPVNGLEIARLEQEMEKRLDFRVMLHTSDKTCFLYRDFIEKKSDQLFVYFPVCESISDLEIVFNKDMLPLIENGW